MTTVVMGNCGVGFAPCRPEQREMLLKVMEGVEDIPGIVMTEGVPWRWNTFLNIWTFSLSDALISIVRHIFRTPHYVFL